jgi:asparagine synthase (glutamine-hydrolysing)
MIPAADPLGDEISSSLSGFYGVLSLRGDRVMPEDLDAMDSAMSYWGPDTAGRWQEGPIALGARLLRVTREDAFDVQPLAEHDIVLVGRIRLDDRGELGRALGIDAADLDALPDSQLVARAWRRWGEACTVHLHGDWVCAIWDPQGRSLWLGRDAAGNTGLYYWSDTERLVFSTSLKALLAHPAVPHRPYGYQIARQLAVVMDPAEETATAYAGVRRIPGGHALRCGHSRMEPYEWWHPDALGELDWAHEDDYHAAFRELYGAAIADRLNTASGSVALMLSAGLDSGSVAALAADQLAARGERLLAYTAVPRFQRNGAPANRLGDERALAQAIADHVGNIEFIPVASEQAGIVASIERMLTVRDQPGHAAVNDYWVLDILRAARDRGARILLTGQGGNATTSWEGSGNLWPALRSGNWFALLSAFRESEAGSWMTLKRQILKPALTPVRGALSRLRNPGRTPWAENSAINPQFAAEIDLYGRMRAAGHDPFFVGINQPRIARFRLGRLASASLGATWMELGAAHQLDVRDPTRDRRLIEFCWRVPDRVFWARGLQRGLMRRGMAGRLPDAVLRSRQKGLQAADIGYRVLADRGAVTAALDRIDDHPVARAWLDVPRMRSVLDALDRGVTPESTQSTGAILLRGMSVGLFLTRF